MKQDRKGKTQVGAWLSPEEKNELSKSVEALGSKSFAALVRMLLPIHAWSKTRKEALARLLEGQERPETQWIAVSVEDDLYREIQKHSMKANVTPSEFCASELEKVRGLLDPDEPGFTEQVQKRLDAFSEKVMARLMKPAAIEKLADQVLEKLKAREKAGVEA